MSISSGGKAMMKCWNKAAGVKEADFRDLPFLNAEQLADFYNCATLSKQGEISDYFILPQDAVVDP